MKKENIKTITDLENWLGIEKVRELFVQHYLIEVGRNLKRNEEKI